MSYIGNSHRQFATGKVSHILRAHTFGLVLSLSLELFSVGSWAVGLLPTPTLKNVQVQAATSYDSPTGRFTFAYTVTNPPNNTGEIWNIKIDVTDSYGSSQLLDPTGLTIPFGSNTTVFSDMLDRLQPLRLPAGVSVVPIGQRVPYGWNGGLTRAGFAMFASGNGVPNIAPGASLNGLAILSLGLPTLRTICLIPDWVLMVDGEATQEEKAEAAAVESSIKFQTYTLGPSGAVAGTYGHWNQLRDDLNHAIQLGWISDATFAQTLTTQLADVRTALDANDGTTAKKRLQTLLNTLSQATSSQRRQEVDDLVRLNAQNLIANTADTPIPYEPQATLLPKTADLAIGASATLTATVINLGDNTPLPDFEIGFKIIDGPHASANVTWINTDAQGKASYSYQGTAVGTDSVAVLTWKQGFEDPSIYDSVAVDWSGGPDLVVPLFVPPVIESAGGKTITITEATVNTGNAPAGPSITRYYLSDQPPPLDPATARVIGERAVPALNPVVLPDGLSPAHMERITLPADLPAGLYSLAACADADNTIVELDEQNNCSFTTLKTGQFVAVPTVSANRPPDCSKAAPAVALLWPPNHKLVAVSISGVTDPDNDPVGIKVVRITQDEPVNGLGDGDTSPDGFGIGQAQAQVRAERSGIGNWRVYAISFRAEDGKGGSCTGTVSVGVPHDQGKGSTPIDDGQKYDSTLP